MIKQLVTMPKSFECLAKYKEYTGGLSSHLSIRGKFVILSSDGIDKKLLEEKQVTSDIVYRKEIWSLAWDKTTPPTTIESYYNTKDGGYIGDKASGDFLLKKGIVPQLATPSHNTCSIGFCEKDKKWYGWSHRAICGFGIGDDYHYQGTCVPEPTVIPKKRTINSLAEAKESAINFAADVN